MEYESHDGIFTVNVLLNLLLSEEEPLDPERKIPVWQPDTDIVRTDVADKALSRGRIGDHPAAIAGD